LIQYSKYHREEEEEDNLSTEEDNLTMEVVVEIPVEDTKVVEDMVLRKTPWVSMVRVGIFVVLRRNY
jgi:hypothetical protein